MATIRGAERQVIANLKHFNTYEEIESSGQKTLKFQLPTEDMIEFLRTAKKLDKLSLASILVIRSFFVSLVSQYDAFLGAIIRTLFLLKSDLLNISERQISFAELLAFGSIEAAREHIIEKEVENVLRKSHSEQFDWLESKFDLKLRKGLESWPSFIELTERRNLFVHTSGKVSQQYLDVCEKNNVVHIDPVIRGQELHASRDYFHHAYETVYEIATKLTHVLWRKALPDDRDNADNNFIEICYELIVEKKYNLALKLLDFASETFKKFASEQNEFIILVNRAQVYKWIGDNTTARKIVQSQDWSAKNDEFKLAEAVLLDKFSDATIIMKRIGTTGKPHKNAYRDWPLFTQFRKSEQFNKAFEDVFGEPYRERSPASEVDVKGKLDELKKRIADLNIPNSPPTIVDPTSE